MFAALIIERDFPRFGDMLGGFNDWLQVVGGFAAAGLGLCLLACLVRRLALPTAGGACALATALLPLLADALRLRWRRVWALAALTIKEVTRRRVLWVFALLGLVFLFFTWFIDAKPETQVHAYVSVLYLVIALL